MITFAPFARLLPGHVSTRPAGRGRNHVQNHDALRLAPFLADHTRNLVSRALD